MSTELIIALLAFGGAVLALITAILSRKKEVIHRFEVSETSPKESAASKLPFVFIMIVIILSAFVIYQFRNEILSKTAVKQAPPATLGLATDYVYWDGDTIKRNSKELPAGWRVAFTCDEKTAGLVVATDFPRKLDAGVWKVWVYFDPDQKSLSQYKTSAPYELPRPAPKQ